MNIGVDDGSIILPLNVAPSAWVLTVLTVGGFLVGEAGSTMYYSKQLDHSTPQIYNTIVYLEVDLLMLVVKHELQQVAENQGLHCNRYNNFMSGTDLHTPMFS